MWDLAVREEDNSGVDAMLARYHGRPPLSLRLLPAAARSDKGAAHRKTTATRQTTPAGRARRPIEA